MLAKHEETASVSEELTKQVSLASDLLAEQRWARGGEALSVIHLNDKIIEAKERELIDCIAENYSKIKGVERELAGLQLQLKLTSGPKKSALELLRRKIEFQNEKVVMARGKFHAARKVAETAEEALKSEEAVKEQLCQELNLLVQQSAHAQLERLEQLTKRMELLNKGFIPAVDSDFDTRSAAAPGLAPEHLPEGCSPQPDDGDAERSFRGQPSCSGDEASGVTTPPLPSAKSLRGPGQNSRKTETVRAEEERAAAARARHVSLKSPARTGASAGRQAPQRPKAPPQPFTGFE